MITFKLEERDFLDGYWLVLSWSPKGRRLILFLTFFELLIGILIVLLEHGKSSNTHLDRFGWGAILCVAGAWAIGLVVRYGLRQRLRSKFNAAKSHLKSTSYSWDAAGIHMMNTDGEKLMPWSKVAKWRQDAKIIAVYWATNKFLFVPTGSFAKDDQKNDFIGHLIKHVGPEMFPSEWIETDTSV